MSNKKSDRESFNFSHGKDGSIRLIGNSKIYQVQSCSAAEHFFSVLYEGKNACSVSLVVQTICLHLGTEIME